MSLLLHLMVGLLGEEIAQRSYMGMCIHHYILQEKSSPTVDVNHYVGKLTSQANALLSFISKPYFNDCYPLLQIEVNLEVFRNTDLWSVDNLQNSQGRQSSLHRAIERLTHTHESPVGKDRWE